MRLIKRQADDGKDHLYLLRDNDLDTSPGLLSDPPDIEQLDWQAIKTEIHNNLVSNQLTTLQSIRFSGSGLDSIILRAIKRPLIELYRSNENV